MTAIGFAEAVLTLRVKYPFSISSWGRSPLHNKNVGGVDDSYHILWMGGDCMFDEWWDPATKKYSNAKKIPQFEKDAQIVGLVALWEGDHYHLQPR